MYKILSSLSAWSVVLPFVVGCIFIKYFKKDSILLFSIVVIALAPQLIHFFSPRSKIEMLSYNVYTVIEFLVYFSLFRTKILRRETILLFWFIIGAYIVLSAYFVLQLDLMNRFINEIAVMNGIGCLVLIGAYFYETFLFDKGELTRTNPFFWYLIGILIYSACTTLVYSLWQRILDNPDSILKNLWNLQNIFNILTYILFTIGFTATRTKNIHANK